MGQEFRKLFILNGRHLPDEFTFGTQKLGRELFLTDASKVVPTADPNLVSDSMRMQQAVMLKQAAQTTPGYNVEAVERNFLEAGHVDQIDSLYPGPSKVAPLPNPKVMIQQAKSQTEATKDKTKRELFILQLMENRRVNDAKIAESEARAVALMEGIEDADAAHELAVLQAQIGATRSMNDSINQRLELMLKEQTNGQQGNGGRMAGAPSNPGTPQIPPGSPAGPDGSMGAGPSFP
jgi:hypothetical protein